MAKMELEQDEAVTEASPGSAETGGDEHLGEGASLLGAVSRRAFLSQLGAAGLAASAPAGLAAMPVAAEAEVSANGGPEGLDKVSVTLKVNGVEHHLTLDTRTTLLDCQEGLRPWAVRGMYGACEWAASELVPVVRGDAW
jgi:hypothetical protein